MMLIEFIIGVFVGTWIGVCLMCSVSVSKDNYYKKRAKELEDEIAMIGWLEVKD